MYFCCLNIFVTYILVRFKSSEITFIFPKIVVLEALKVLSVDLIFVKSEISSENELFDILLFYDINNKNEIFFININTKVFKKINKYIYIIVLYYCYILCFVNDIYITDV